jgi:hypothetical protein
MGRKAKGERGLLLSPCAGARLAQAREWIEALDPAERALVVVPSALAGARLCQPLLTQGRARFGLQRVTLQELSLRLATAALAERGLAPADTGAEQALVARTLARLADRGALGRFAAVGDRPGLPRALGRTLLELSLARVSPERL